MKYLQKICCLALIFGLCFSLCITVSAAGEINYNRYDYYIENYQIDAKLEENNVISITENIVVNYNQEKQGIVRILPVRPEVDKFVDGEYKKMTYRTEIENLQVNANFETYTEDDYLMIQIGTKGVYNLGQKEYTISYTMDMGDDRIDSFDEVFYSLIGADWDCPIKNVEFSVQMPKDFDQSEIRMYSGRFGAVRSDNIEYTVKENKISGKVIGALDSAEGLTFYTLLPEGYFVNERQVNANAAMALSMVAIGLFAIIAVCIIKSKKSRNIVQTVEFYSPEGITSAQVGYIMDGDTSSNEVLSLIVWLADKKYITIEEKSKKEIILAKTKKSPEELPSHVKPLYDGIFEFGDSVDIQSLNLYDSVAASAGLVGLTFKGERKLKTNLLRSWAAAAGVLLAVVGGTSVTMYGGLVYGQMTIAGFFTAVIALLMFFIFQIAASGWRFAKPSTRTTLIIIGVILAAIPVCITLLLSQEYSFGGAILPTITAIVAVLGCAVAGFTDTYTEYMRSIQGKILGFREFINSAEKEKLEQLVEESPDYFFNVLPYAYVFGLTDKWINKFETINLSTTTANAMPMIYATHAVSRIRSNIAPPINTSNLSSGKSIGSSYSGGGFSGGGFGGGGGRSW